MVNKVIPSIATLFKIRKTLNSKTESTIHPHGGKCSEFKVVLPTILPSQIKIK
jgi:hypothetical protein